MRHFTGLALLGLPLLLASCGSTSLKAPDNAPPESVISGQISTWSGSGTGTVSLRGRQDLVSAPVDATGHFSLTLPQGQTLASETRPVPETLVDGLSLLNCRDNGVTSTNPAARALMVFSLQAREASGSRDILAASVSKGALSVTVNARAWLYVDAATGLGGKVSCSVGGLTVPVTLDVQAVPGWNMLALTLRGSFGLNGLTASGDVVRTVLPVKTFITQDELQAALQ